MDTDTDDMDEYALAQNNILPHHQLDPLTTN
jgi:hypothetical protein